MSSEPPPPAPKSRLISRIVLLIFGALLLVYFVPLAVSLFTAHGSKP